MPHSDAARVRSNALRWLIDHPPDYRINPVEAVVDALQAYRRNPRVGYRVWGEAHLLAMESELEPELEAAREAARKKEQESALEAERWRACLDLARDRAMSFTASAPQVVFLVDASQRPSSSASLGLVEVDTLSGEPLTVLSAPIRCRGGVHNAEFGAICLAQALARRQHLTHYRIYSDNRSAVVWARRRGFPVTWVSRKHLACAHAAASLHKARRWPSPEEMLDVATHLCAAPSAPEAGPPLPLPEGVPASLRREIAALADEAARRRWPEKTLRRKARRLAEQAADSASAERLAMHLFLAFRSALPATRPAKGLPPANTVDGKAEEM